jgi:hypothetical protein
MWDQYQNIWGYIYFSFYILFLNKGRSFMGKNGIYSCWMRHVYLYLYL